MKRRLIYGLVIFSCAAVFLFSLVKVLQISGSYRQAEAFYEAAAETYVSKKPDIERKKNQPPVSVDFSELLKINEDVIGWIYMEDTVVNYPLLQGENNYYYLDKTYYKNYLASGSIYLDTGNDRRLRDSHSVIYGHNMKNHTMFGDMDRYTDAEYLKAHPYVDILLTDGTWLRYKIFSVYTADVEDGTYQVPLNEKKAFEKYLKLTKEKNIYKDSGTDAPDGIRLPQVHRDDRVITLSTCTEDSAELQRFVVTALLTWENGIPVQ